MKKVLIGLCVLLIVVACIGSYALGYAAGTPDDTADYTLLITDVNEAPTVALVTIITTLPEDADTSVRIKVADIIVTDDALGSNTLSLSGADAAQFEIVGLELYLRAGVILDYETQTQLNVTVEISDGIDPPTAMIEIDTVDELYSYADDATLTGRQLRVQPGAYALPRDLILAGSGNEWDLSGCTFTGGVTFVQGDNTVILSGPFDWS